MTQVERRVRSAGVRITLNTLMEQIALALVIGAAAFALLLLIDRSFAVVTPPALLVWAPLSLAVAIGGAGVVLRHSTRLNSAMALDRAAGLKERISTAVALAGDKDPFVRAAIADADRAAAAVNVRHAIPLRVPKLAPWSVSSLISAALLFWLMPELNLFAASKADESAQELAAQAEARNVNTAVEAKINEVQERAQRDGSLKELVEDLKPLALPENATRTPDDVRREALKRIDNVAEKLAEKQDLLKPEALNELKRQLAQLESPKPDSATSKLTDALSKGDMNAATKAAAELKKQMEEAAQKGDEQSRAQLAEMAKQLESLSAQLAKQADQQKMEKELQNKAGLSEEQAKQLLQQLANMDPKQLEQELKKQLANSGMKQEEIKQLAQKLAQQKEAMQQMKQMANALSKCASACDKAGQGDGAAANAGAAAMSDAEGQLSAMEMAEQSLNEIEAQLGDLKALREGVCNGNFAGRKPGDEIGNQGPNEGFGYGSRVGKNATAHQYQPSKVNASSGRGEIIGRTLIDGPQAKGQASAEVVEAVTAAVRDATDAIDQQRAPRQYENVLRAYFESLAGLAPAASLPPGAPQDAPKEKVSNP